MNEQNVIMDSEAKMMRQADFLVECVEHEVSLMKDLIGHAVSHLYDYVNRRELRALDGENEIDQLLESIMMVGGAIDMVSNNSYLGLLPNFLAKENPELKVLLSQAENYLQLDFPDEATWMFYGVEKKPLQVFSLEQIAALSGRTIGSIRNATLQGGGLQTIRLEVVFDNAGEPVNQSVFVEYVEALRWLEMKNCYEPLKDESLTDESRIEFIRTYGPHFDATHLPKELRLRDKGQLQVYYAPFDYINRQAKVVLCGITPGAAQTEIALNTFAESLQRDCSIEEAFQHAKQAASFAGSMRSSLTKMLDHVGLHNILGISSSADLFGEHSDLVHYTSALKNPVFYKGGNYTGTPLMLKDEALKWQVDEILAEEVKVLDDTAIYIPLGPKPAEALMYLANKGLLSRKQILVGIPHPSGANAERIKYFCEEKARDSLSSKTNAELIDQARALIQTQLAEIDASIQH